MKIGFVCDSHVGGGEKSPQKAYLLKAIRAIKEDEVNYAIHLGDITAFGEEKVFTSCLSIFKKLNNAFVLLGNADVRCADDREKIINKAEKVCFSVENKTFLGLNLTSGKVSNDDFEKILLLKDGDVLMMHYGVHSLAEESKDRLIKILEEKALLVIHAHSHKKFDYAVGKSRVVGLRALDPDKSIGDFPCITYYDTESGAFTERVFASKKETLEEIYSYFGASCTDNEKDLEFVTLNKIRFLELKIKSNLNEEKVYSLVRTWREKVGGYLSIHMPNLKYEGGEITCTDEWERAFNLAVEFNADGLTIHPPKVKKSVFYENAELRDKFIDFYASLLSRVDEKVKIGVENIHRTKKEKEDGLSVEELGFGYLPQDVLFLAKEINKKLGSERVFVVLDVGHAKNNGALSSQYTLGRWYEEVGDKIVAYHIHQVLQTDGGMKNHNVIDSWFGPLVSYSSFFYSWENGLINKAPIFLEIRKVEDIFKSIDVFEKTFLK